MRRPGYSTLILGGAAALLLPAIAAAWTPYGYGPPWATGTPGYDPRSGAPWPAEPAATAETPAYGYGYGPTPPPGYGIGYGPGYGPAWPGPAGYGPSFGVPWTPPLTAAPPAPEAGTTADATPSRTPSSAPGQPPADFGPPWMGGYGGPPPVGFGSYGDDGDAPGAMPGGPGSGPTPPPGYPDRFQRPGSLRISQSMTDDAYVLEIKLDGQRPEAVQIEPQGHGLLIRRDSSAQTEEQDSFDHGQGYSRRYSYASGRTQRRLAVPRDGDLAALKREDTADSIRVSIPRRQQP